MNGKGDINKKKEINLWLNIKDEFIAAIVR